MLTLDFYQEVARDFVRNHPRAGVWVDPGLGKTAIALSAIDESWRPTLVIAPKLVAINTWPTERDLWRPDLSFTLVKGDPAERSVLLEHGFANSDVTVIGRDVAADALGRPWRSVIWDESSRLRTRNSVSWRTAAKLRRDAERFVQLTGSPSPNSLMDIWAQLALIDGGEALGKTLTAYRNRYFYAAQCLPSGVVTKWVLQPGAEDEIYEKIEHLVIGLQAKYRIQLPERRLNTIKIDLPPKAQKLAKSLRETLVADMAEIYGEGEVHTAGNAAILSSKLRQINAGAIYADADSERAGEYTRLHSAKIAALKEIVEEAQGNPIIVFYQFRFEADMIREAFPHVETPDGDFAKRWNAGEIPLLMSHPTSMQFGLNLQKGGHTIVWLSPTWSLEDWEQANARVYRRGQTERVVIHTICGPGDARIVKAVEDKDDQQTALKEFLESPI